MRADLDAQQMPRLGPEPEPARGASLTSRLGTVGGRLDDQPGLEKSLHDALDRGPGQARDPRQVGERR